MHVVSDEERREVARRLRHAWVNVPDTNRVRHHLRVLCEIYEAIGVSGDRRDAIDLFDRLADLIEPPARCPHYHSGRHYCSVHEDMALIDRDALLALEDEMFEDATGLAFISQLEKNEELQDLQSTMAKALMDYAHRIRKALGVES